MTSKDALLDIQKRNEALKKEGHFHIGTLTMNVIEKLVERDTSMKLIGNIVTDLNTHNQWGVLHCPKCSCVVVYSTYQMPPILPNYCQDCGQKLDWS